ncbi:hypothetical protein EDC04DRAFT_2795067 [Pisolithus marmoratus]|nr:hypothetical protein EDC04DRAFT_2795067 [Pisolithus marmoratus]
MSNPLLPLCWGALAMWTQMFWFVMPLLPKSRSGAVASIIALGHGICCHAWPQCFDVCCLAQLSPSCLPSCMPTQVV